MPLDNLQLILASGSDARKKMLQNAGLKFDVIPANIDETKIMNNLQGKHLPATDICLTLATEKSLSVSKDKEDFFVIGSDQVLCLHGQIFSKAKDKNDAIKKLKILRGKTHELHSSICLAKNGKILWKTIDTSQLTMHDFDDNFLDSYIATAGNILTQCVGAYAIEGTGAWLFREIRGDCFTIMGMPLIPLLAQLKQLGFTP